MISALCGRSFCAYLIQFSPSDQRRWISVSRTLNTVPATSAPAAAGYSTSSRSDSRPCSPTGIPGKRGVRFHPTPNQQSGSAQKLDVVPGHGE